MYSRNHCLTRISNEAAIRLNRRLANHRTFTRISTDEGWNGEAVEGDWASSCCRVDEFPEGPLFEDPLFVRFWYDSMRNAVKTVEKRPVLNVIR